MQPPVSDGQAPANPRYQEILDAPLPEPGSMDTPTRIARIGLYREMRLAGIFVPPEHLRFAISLITIDRASKATEARKNSSSAKKASSGQVAMPSIEDL